MRTLAVISRKGGVGKTTLSVNLAVAAHRAGLTTVVADLDSQRSATAWARARAQDMPGPAVMETTRGKVFTLWSAAANAGCDLFIIDTPASPEEDVLQAARLADLCLLVTRPNYFDVSAITQSIELLRHIGKSGLIVLNQAPARRGGMEALPVLQAAEILNRSGMPLARMGVRHRAAFAQAASMGLGIQELEGAGRGAEEMAGVWAQVHALLTPRAANVKEPGSLPALHTLQIEVGSPAARA